MVEYDLHVHSSASDGTWAPTQLVKTAKEMGLVGVGVTDHDTLSGIDEAISAGHELGVVIVPGVELSTETSVCEVHILGYLLDETNTQLTQFLEESRNGRLRRLERMVDKLRVAGCDVSFDRVLQIAGGEGSVGRPHLAEALIEKGYAANRQDAFDRLLAKGCPGFVPRRKVTPEEAVEVIVNAKGVPVLAHPGLDFPDDCFRNDMLERLIGVGLQGLEVYHSSHTPQVQEALLSVSKERGLLVTGGSDSHGPGAKEGAALASRGVGQAEVTSLISLRTEKYGPHPTVEIFA